MVIPSWTTSRKKHSLVVDSESTLSVRILKSDFSSFVLDVICPCYKPCTIGILVPAATVSITGKRECGTYNKALEAKSPVEPPSPPNNNQYVGSYYADRSRTSSRSANACRVERTASEHPQRPADNESDTSSAFSSSGTPRLITSKINSLKNVHHKPGGGNVSIVNEKVQLGPIASKCNSFANVKHKPGGGNVVIVDEKLDLTGVHSKISSLKNVKHVPGGGQTQIKTYKLNFTENATSKIGPLSKMTHTPGGGNVQIRNEKLNFTENASPKIGHLSKMTHTPGGGNVQIVSHKLEFDKTAKSKIGSLKNAQHRAGGGDVQIFREQLPWLKYNKPNLPPEERARINKHRSLSHSEMSNSINSSST
ncbi:microtubule-associated protein 2 [Clonorchis sinensis]|uniref:Microtubule-associated protein n=1 Tax=Clonorchis sinensis TaxID=79923 RepID=G7Y6V0_CLOSI|nr:microtubule-associated protein 2 [Clonorchis sinensis]